MKNLGLVLLTALPPTEGHLALVTFAGHYMKSVGGSLTVLVGVLPDEPPGRAEHAQCLEIAVRDAGFSADEVRVEVQFSNDPQGPSGPDDDAFWEHWVGVLSRQTWGQKPTHLFSSEDYGDRLSASMGAQHVPFDRARSMSGARATDVRRHPVLEFGSIIAPLRERLTRRVCLFGQESTGKTSTARTLASDLNGVFSPEWARPYLESLPTPETTLDRMRVILHGQRAQERVALAAAHRHGKPFVFLDTDLLSTLGFMELYMRQFYPIQEITLRNEIEERIEFADLYLVMDDSIPFEPDPLRYGVDRRETSVEYWVGLLQRFGCRYEVIRGGSRAERTSVAAYHAQECLLDRMGFFGYERRR